MIQFDEHIFQMEKKHQIAIDALKTNEYPLKSRWLVQMEIS